MELAPMFVQAVEGAEDTFAFRYDFGIAPEGKATADAVTFDTDSVTETEDGDLVIEGLAANFEGLDRTNENFGDGAFQRGIKSFLRGQGALCFHHKHDHGIGRVLDLREEEGKGLWLKARVDKQQPTSPLRYIYDGIRKGTYRGLSVGGFFKRAGRKIVDVDLTEVSVTPVPVHPGTGFAVVAGKALADLDSAPADDAATADLEQAGRALAALSDICDRLEGKALPKAHDPRAASQLKSLHRYIGNAREWAGIAKDSDNNELASLADDVETVSVKWEAAVHRLAAKIGPLPADSII